MLLKPMYLYFFCNNILYYATKGEAKIYNSVVWTAVSLVVFFQPFLFSLLCFYFLFVWLLFLYVVIFMSFLNFYFLLFSCFHFKPIFNFWTFLNYFKILPTLSLIACSLLVGLTEMCAGVLAPLRLCSMCQMSPQWEIFGDAIWC